jgi:hypothetical protein
VQAPLKTPVAEVKERKGAKRAAPAEPAGAEAPVRARARK